MKNLIPWLVSGLLLVTCSCAHWSGSNNSNNSNNSDKSTKPQSLVLKKVWVRPTEVTEDFEYHKNVRMEPLILSDRIIQGNGFDGLVAVDRGAGHIIWQLPIPGGVEGGVTYADDYLFFGGNDGQFYSASIKTGKLLWSVPVRLETLSAPTLYNGMVYFLTGNNVLHALDAVDGRELWIYSRVDSSNFSVRGASVPTINDGRLFVGFSDGFLVSLEAKTGAIQWETPLNTKGAIFHDLDSQPVVDGNGFLYVLGYDGHLYCVKAKSGELVWKSEPGGFGQVVIVNDKIFYSTSKGEVVGLNKNDGALLWSYKVPQGVATSPRVFKEFLAIGESAGSFRLLNQSNGKEVASFAPGSGIHSPIAIDEKNNEFYFLSNTAWLYKMTLGTASQKAIFGGFL